MIPAPLNERPTLADVGEQEGQLYVSVPKSMLEIVLDVTEPVVPSVYWHAMAVVGLLDPE